MKKLKDILQNQEMKYEDISKAPTLVFCFGLLILLSVITKMGF
jgi:hypothetical protein